MQAPLLSLRWQCLTGLLVLTLTLGACSPAANPTGDATPFPTTNTGGEGGATPTSEIAQDVPILAGATNLKVASNGTDISYRVVLSFEEAVKFYQEELQTLGWEQKSKKDTGFANNITLLRFKTEATLSVTIQTIAGSDELNIRITRLPK